MQLLAEAYDLYHFTKLIDGERDGFANFVVSNLGRNPI